MPSVLALIALVVLASPFGGATAGAVSVDDGLTIEVTVEVTGAYEVVLARPFSSFQELPPTALSDLGDGTWGGFVTLPTAENWSLVFDAIAADGTAVRSDTVDLLALGVDRVVITGEPTVPAATGLSTATWWLIAAVVLILAALGALTWWTFGGDAKPDDADEGDDPDDPGDVGDDDA